MALTKKELRRNELITLATEMAKLLTDADEILNANFANEFHETGANEFVDGDFTGNPATEHLTAATFYSALNALTDLVAHGDTNGRLQALRGAAYDLLER